MNRREFIQKAGAAGAAAMLSSKLNASPDCKKEGQLLNAYYFRAHLYTCVPRQIREDMQWMADIGTDIVSVGVLEQDLFAALENIAIICEEAERVGMQVYAVPSRWGGLVAGAPKVPSLFSIMNQQTWMKEEGGSYLQSRVSGRISSIHYPETVEFMKNSLSRIFELWPVRGVIWDEPKCLKMDHSDGAIEKLGPGAPYEKHIEAAAAFFGGLNEHIKGIDPSISTNLFAYANLSQPAIDIMAQTPHLDFFGCDGRPWRPDDGGKDESHGKTLLVNGERFLPAARANGKGTLWLIENHNMLDRDATLMDERLPEVLSHDIGHLIYYYYPRNLETPDLIMDTIRKHLKG